MASENVLHRNTEDQALKSGKRSPFAPCVGEYRTAGAAARSRRCLYCSSTRRPELRSALRGTATFLYPERQF